MEDAASALSVDDAFSGGCFAIYDLTDIIDCSDLSHITQGDGLSNREHFDLIDLTRIPPVLVDIPSVVEGPRFLNAAVSDDTI